MKPSMFFCGSRFLRTVADVFSYYDMEMFNDVYADFYSDSHATRPLVLDDNTATHSDLPCTASRHEVIFSFRSFDFAVLFHWNVFTVAKYRNEVEWEWRERTGKHIAIFGRNRN